MGIWTQITIGGVTAAVAAVLASAGSIAGARATRQAALTAASADRTTATEENRWQHREETMRMLRWAADKALDADEATGDAGLVVLDALQEAELLQTEDEAFVMRIASRIATLRWARYPQPVEFLSGDDKGGANNG